MPLEQAVAANGSMTRQSGRARQPRVAFDEQGGLRDQSRGAAAQMAKIRMDRKREKEEQAAEESAKKRAKRNETSAPHPASSATASSPAAPPVVIPQAPRGAPRARGYHGPPHGPGSSPSMAGDSTLSAEPDRLQVQGRDSQAATPMQQSRRRKRQDAETPTGSEGGAGPAKRRRDAQQGVESTPSPPSASVAPVSSPPASAAMGTARPTLRGASRGGSPCPAGGFAPTGSGEPQSISVSDEEAVVVVEQQQQQPVQGTALVVTLVAGLGVDAAGLHH